MTLLNMSASQLPKIGIVLPVPWQYVFLLEFTHTLNLQQFSESGDFLYFIAEDTARVKVFALPVPPTPSQSTIHPRLTGPYRTPVPLTSTHAASGVQVLPNGRLCFSVSSFTSPNEAYVLSNLRRVEADIMNQVADIYRGELAQITRFSVDSLQDKFMHPGEEFWFEGALQQIHGWILTPPGYKPTDVKKWPILLLIHGGSLSFTIHHPSCVVHSGYVQVQRLAGKIPGRRVGIQMVKPGPKLFICHPHYSGIVFANQGYFVVAINPTGSTSFGQSMVSRHILKLECRIMSARPH